ncbi:MULTISPECIES: beta-ketoacyl synthase N-terminal-like domain-containing protein [Bacillus]|uniref:beta-ketoacyl synthase N-terminal-like domain-containing protein n=1 Tax=Bacillus TaxID=1386 RepID=UPI001298833C|nr:MULTISPECIES: beta-ketoacyl synthase N-terminal-like domain-containing protein [Bacillus]MRB24550.1 MBL fold metallo-hydrolase [Bacillus thuringiensis]MDA2309431.1 beta-ketoacyl synthase N-terminal-like domain-containing protein [Bacillus cereus]MDA2316739.1 beta-ketoacyl synthase N-terminal-like domain-containing protein [Bacillus cereus]MDA2498345.1 beta-ketoacyl synthase N-terminal-like domain-containing protein [Bacillus cereus]MDF9610672.1 beta-ketoacyl synthase N-terminal-like domain-
MENIFDLNSEKNDFQKEFKDKRVAVVGVAAKLPDATNHRIFWGNLINGIESISVLGDERQEDAQYVMSKFTHRNNGFQKMGFIESIDKFDFKYFNIPHQNAVLMDPRQRLFLETSVKALLDAGYPQSKINGSNTGVYVGASNNDSIFTYEKILYDLGMSDPAGIVNNLPSMIASRVSYELNLKGPSMVIDTSCSSSLVAIHQACKAIDNEECEIAIAGGVSINILPIETDIRLGIESKSGSTRAFDENSDGTVFAEGVVSVILKPVYKAKLDNDNIYCIVDSSEINNNGNTIGLAAPSMEGQRHVMTECIKKSQVNINNLKFIEAHGTGTNLGDVIEIETIKQSIGKFSTTIKNIAVGSVKNNIGHALSASGSVGFLKGVLSMTHRVFPRNANFSTPNKKIDFNNSPVYVNTENDFFDLENGNKTGLVSSYGMSGTNCNILLAEYNHPNDECKIGKVHYFTFSAKTINSLKNLIEEYIDFIQEDKEINLQNLSYTLNNRRDHYEFKIVFKASNIDEVIEYLKASSHFLSRDEKNDIKIGGIYYSKNILSELNMENSFSGGDKYCLDYVNGEKVDWNILSPGKVVSLPTYHFEKLRCWFSDGSLKYKLIEDIELEDYEDKVVKVWAETFGLTEVSLKQDIYSVGGDSLSLISMFNELKKEVKSLELEDFIENETLLDILEYVRNTKKHISKSSIVNMIFKTDDMVVYQLQNGVNNSNAYLINKKDGCIMIDAGIKIENLKEILLELSINSIDYLILTHGHFDHIFSAEEIVALFGSKVIISHDELSFANDIVSNGLAVMNKSFISDISNIIQVEDTQKIDINGLAFEFYSCPGHTEGSIGIMCDKLLFTGDTLFKEITPQPDKKVGNKAILETSILKLKQLCNSDTIICPGHEEIATIETIKL